MSQSDQTYSASEIRAALLEEIYSLLRPSIYWGLGFGAFGAYLMSGKDGWVKAAFSGVFAAPFFALILFVLAWCHREGARSTESMPRIIYGSILVLWMQMVFRGTINFAIGLVKGPIYFIQVIYRLRQVWRA